MSSQDNKGLPLSHAPNNTGYKLLELPAEVLELLESDNPPMYARSRSFSGPPTVYPTPSVKPHPQPPP